MKKINELIEPSLDAIDYRAKEKKKFFLDAYVETDFLKKACNSNCYYFIGEKGTGKTALAFHMQNASPKNISSKLISISETQYARFINLKQKGQLEYTDYSIVWRATLLYLIAKLVVEKKKKWIHRINGKFSAVENAINKYDRDSQLPELEYVIEFVTTLTQTSEITGNLPEVVKAGLTENNSQTTKSSTKEIKAALQECEKILKSGLQGVKLKDDIALFIDGLDAKPNGVDFVEYQNCLTGLAEAAWHLNSEYFASAKDTNGRMRCVLLLRPDVFDSLNLHNSNCKLEDNSVIFHWHTTDDLYKESDLYKVSDKYFTSQCGSFFGWSAHFQEKRDGASASFKKLLRMSFHRPRDIFSAIKILIGLTKASTNANSAVFQTNDLTSPAFADKFSEYLLGEVKNYANYYVTNREFDIFVAFFQYLNGSTRFDYQEFCKAYNAFVSSPSNEAVKSKPIVGTPESFLQFWYDVNVIGYTEQVQDSGNDHFHWSHRERSAAKVMPKVKENCNYRVQPGIAKALNLGKKFTPT
ncbi:P-loop ATPase, Sll1717 family [Achromobacter sp. UMC71]|uniref:P-loop ATPase, Sll1717 family n=1 Tax=Achromobacter sp. UMC71 TaxID=1862320 RepID=UPI0015FFE789|nr:hypothetical protein [Achromobacter sp. UMC71]